MSSGCCDYINVGRQKKLIKKEEKNLSQPLVKRNYIIKYII